MNERGVSFYCNDCRLDQNHPPRINDNSYGAWFVARCVECDKKLIRYITNRHLDPYYHESLELKKQRSLFKKELIQPGDPLFKKYYKTEYDKLELTASILEEKKAKEKNDRDKFYEKFKYAPSKQREIVKNVLGVEERM